MPPWCYGGRSHNMWMLAPDKLSFASFGVAEKASVDEKPGNGGGTGRNTKSQLRVREVGRYQRGYIYAEVQSSMSLLSLLFEFPHPFSAV
ncbi:hypothetical protein TWF696_001409 [Orbilia brochopaga]|uniref:Uncharacterized protein n=1 Tax=Orbilia brochopaga TaxID=3140254 RepID=A0AAV9UC44_9PEZI